METAQSVKAAIWAREWAVFTDISDAYLQITILCVQQCKGTFSFVSTNGYHFMYLPFPEWQLLHGSSPNFWGWLCISHICKGSVYMSIWTIGSSGGGFNRDGDRASSQLVIRVQHHLGLILNFQKLELTPTQDFEFIRMYSRTQKYTVERMSEHKGPISSLSLLLVQTQAARWKAAAPQQLTGAYLYLDIAKSGNLFHGYFSGMDTGHRLVHQIWSRFSNDGDFLG